MPTLQWLGRDEAVLAAERVPFRLLEHAPEDRDEQEFDTYRGLAGIRSCRTFSVGCPRFDAGRTVWHDIVGFQRWAEPALKCVMGRQQRTDWKRLGS